MVLFLVELLLRSNLFQVGSFTCDLGFILDPSKLKGEISNQVSIYCRKDLVCGGTDWKLDDGSDLPECLPGKIVRVWGHIHKTFFMKICKIFVTLTWILELMSLQK
jgi:hypothetical protein